MAKYNWEEIQKFYDAGNSYGDVIKHYGMSSRTIYMAQKRGVLQSRSQSEAMVLLYKRRPELNVRSNTARAKISESMKKAHAEGRAWNIGMSRWNNEPSWPEKFFMQVIQNEFTNQDYVMEHPFRKFSLDFAWLSLKKCIEIDGDQHFRNEDQKRRDAEKNQLLADNGWEILRIVWRDMYADTKFWIAKAKQFIDE